MKATIDSAGRLVIPRALRERLGLRQGPVDVEVDGADLRVTPHAGEELEERDGLLVIPAAGQNITDQDVQELRDADQR